MSAVRPRGFTLIELLLALALSALVGLLAHTALSVALGAAEGQRRAVQDLQALQQALDWLERDLMQAVPRPVTDARGVLLPALAGGDDPRQLLQLTRDGWDNPRGEARAELQRVHYRLDPQGRLWRRYWRRLDAPDAAGQVEMLLLDGVSAVQLAFLDGGSLHAARSALGGEWRERWPLAVDDTLPLAVMVTLDTEAYGPVRRIIELPAAAP